MVECKKCSHKYIVISGLLLKHGLADHHGYNINHFVSRATGAHFNLPGHSLADMSVSILEHTRNSAEEYRNEREK